MKTISIVIPAKDEAQNLARLLPALTRKFSSAQIIVVNDGSTDNTADICHKYGVEVISNPYSMGNGAAIKAGARQATGEILVFMDGDGQHNPSDIPKLLNKLDEGYSMAIGARSYKSQASVSRLLGNSAFNRLASLMSGFKILDLTSGFRAVTAQRFKNFLYLLPNGFSYPTTITMAFFRSGYAVAYIPIEAAQRLGTSNINIIRDGLRFFIIILKIGALFSPMRLFLPISLFHFFIGIAYYTYTYIAYGRFTNMSALLLIASLLTFLIGIVSEQISALHYRNSEERRRISDQSTNE